MSLYDFIEDRIKICFVRLRDTVHYDGTNGKQIMDSFFHVTNEFIKNNTDKYYMDTYNLLFNPLKEKRMSVSLKKN